MKPVQYRNRRPIEYTPHDIRLALKSKRYYTRDFIIKRRRRKLPGIFVGVSGIIVLLAGELIQGGFGIVLFAIGTVLTAAGAHFEILNRVSHQYGYFIVPVIAVMLCMVYVIRPQTFTPLLPKQYESLLTHFSSGFPFNSTELTVIFGGRDGVSVKYTRKQLEEAKKDSLSETRTGIPFEAYLDNGKLFLNADVFAGTDVPPIRIRGNVIHGLPYRWDGNYNSRALEVVSADTMPVFQLVYISEDSIRIRGVFQLKGGLAIVDESGVSWAQKNRVLFYGTRSIFKYPSWKFQHQLKSPF